MELSQEAREARRAYKRRWREKNRERIREYDREWRKRNPDKVKEYERRRWEKEAAMRTLLIEKRKAKDLTVADMAKLLDKSSSFYYKIEAGIRNPNITTAKQIADIVGGTVDELFFDNTLDSSSNNDETSATSETA